MARRSRRNRRRSRGRFAFLYRLLCFVLICAAIVGALVLFFKVDTISVSGNDRYSRETILAASGMDAEACIHWMSSASPVRHLR